MANETIITVVGNLTADPELKTTQNGVSLCNFTIASTPRTFNRQTNQWDDGAALFMRCTAWRDLADHIVATMTKGMHVIAQGRLNQRQYQAQDGSQRSILELQIDEIGPSLRYATANVTKTSQNTGFKPNQQPAQAQAQPTAQTAWTQASTDPWAATDENPADAF